MIRDVTPDPHPSPAGSRTPPAGERLVTVHSDRVRRSQPVEMTPSMAYALVRNPRRLENREPLRIRAAVTALSELNDPNPTVIRRVRLGEAPPADPARSTEPPSRTGPRPTKPGEVRAHVDRTTYRTLPRPGGRDAAVVAQVFGLLDSDAPVRPPAPTPERAPDAPSPADAPAAAAAGAVPTTSSDIGPRGTSVPTAAGDTPSPAGPASPAGATTVTGPSSATGADGAGSPGAGAPAVRPRPAPSPSSGTAGEPPASVRDKATDPAATGPQDASVTPPPADGQATAKGGVRPDARDSGSAAAGDAATASPAVDEAGGPPAPKLRWWQRLFGRRTSKGCQMCGWRGEGPCPLGHR